MLEVDCLGWCWPGWALSSRRPWSPWGLALLGLGLAATRLPEWLVVLLAGRRLLRAGRLYAVEPLGPLWFFWLVGSTLFGSGYVLVGLLQEMVHRGWLFATDLLTARSLGQITPGPLLTPATAAGYLAAGVPGAILATLGIFLPSFVLTALVVEGWAGWKATPWLKPSCRELPGPPWDSSAGPCGCWARQGYPAGGGAWPCWPCCCSRPASR